MHRKVRPLLLTTLTAATVSAGLLASSAAATTTFAAPVVVSSLRASEPGVNVAKDGTIYVNAPDGLLSTLPGSPSLVWRSDNGGASFSQLPASLKANLPGGGDSNITVGPDGTLSETDLWLGSSTVSVSTDKGQTWTAQPLQGIVAQDRQWVAATSGGRVYHVTHQIPTGLYVSRSLDSGLTYPQHVLAATPLDQTGCVCPPGNLIAEDGGLLADKVGVVFATSDGGVGFARSTNGGLTFTVTRPGPASVATTNGAFPVVADAGGGKLTAVWNAVQGNTSSVMLAQSPDFGATWSQPLTLVSGGANVYPWVAAQGSKLAVSLYHSPVAGTPDGVPASAQWFESYLESTDGGVTFGALTTADPTVAKSGPICTGGINCSSGRELGDFQTVALDNSLKAVLSYAHSIDGTNTEVRFVKQS
ncbi:MAG: hypothetical protein NVS3B26_30150 [Mycobacteriales bacterium]